MTAALPPEGDDRVSAVLLACARALADPHASPVPDEVPAQLELEEWSALLSRLRVHGLAPAAWRMLGSHPALPQDIGRELRHSYQVAALNHSVLTAELLSVLGAFRAANLRVVPFKGVAFAAAEYADPALRLTSDLDLLLSREDLPAAQSVLEGRRYRLALSPEEHQHHLHYRYHLHYVSCGFPQIDIELHWRLTPAYWPFPLDFEAIWSRAAAMPVSPGAAQSIPSVTPEDMVLALSANGAKEGWPRLKIVCDLARVCINHPDLDWHYVLSLAGRMRRTRIVLLGIALAYRLAQRELPEQLTGVTERVPDLEALTNRFWGRLLYGLSPGSEVLAAHRNALALWSNWSDRIAYLRYITHRIRQRLPRLVSSRGRFLRSCGRYWRRPRAAALRLLSILTG